MIIVTLNRTDGGDRALKIIIIINIIIIIIIPLGFLAWRGNWPDALTLNLEEQVIFGQGCLTLAFAKPMTNYKAAVYAP